MPDSSVLHKSGFMDMVFKRPQFEPQFILLDNVFRPLSDIQGYFDAPNSLVPFRNVRYHLNEAGPVNSPQTPAGNQFGSDHLPELFNLRHSSIRCTIERAFGILRMR